MRELVKIIVAVAVTELLFRVAGVWPWLSAYLEKWPWLAERYALTFALVLAFSLLALRRWHLARSNLAVAILSASMVGWLACLFSLVFAQLITATGRSNFWAGLQLDGGVTGFLLFGSAIASFRAFSWLYGALASMLALLADRAEAYFERPQVRAE